MDRINHWEDIMQPKENELLDNTTSIFKDQISLFIQNITSFSSNIDAAKDFADFERIKKEIKDFLVSIFEEMMKWKSSDFITWFEQSNISKYHTEHELQKIDLMKLIAMKNRFYLETLREIVSNWKLDSILKHKDSEDIVNIIESWVFSFLDDVFIEWYKNVYNGENEWITSEELVYWWVKGGRIVDLATLAENEIIIDDEKLRKINNEHIRKYLLTFSKFIKDWTTDYKSWVDAEVLEVKSWQNRDDILWIVGPMEDYISPGLLVEPELMLLMKNLNKKINFEDFYGLSEEYYGNRYWMDNMTLDFVETLLQTWDCSFGGFIGKAFPNDVELSNKEWNCIIIKDTNMKQVVDNAKKWLLVLFWEDFIIDDEKLYNELIKQVAYHEFGHSLFIKWNFKSLLEEAKATLFYYLKVFHENTIESYSEEDIRRVIEFTVMDSIRNLERINESASKKYVILTKMNLSHLFANWLLQWEGDKLAIDSSKEKFEEFILAMRKALEYIKENYKLDDESLKKEEARYLIELEENIKENVWKMVSKLNI